MGALYCVPGWRVGNHFLSPRAVLSCAAEVGNGGLGAAGMTTTSRSQDWRRLVIAGVAAGMVMNVMDAVTNGVLMLAEFQRNSIRLGLSPTAAETPAAIVILGGVDIVWGLALVWLYDAMIPRYGPGMRTALKAAVVLYLGTLGVIVGFALMGVLDGSMLAKMATAGAATLAAGAVTGARVYGLRGGPRLG